MRIDDSEAQCSRGIADRMAKEHHDDAPRLDLACLQLPLKPVHSAVQFVPALLWINAGTKCTLLINRVGAALVVVHTLHIHADICNPFDITVCADTTMAKPSLEPQMSNTGAECFVMVVFTDAGVLLQGVLLQGPESILAGKELFACITVPLLNGNFLLPAMACRQWLRDGRDWPGQLQLRPGIECCYQSHLVFCESSHICVFPGKFSE